MNITGLMLLCVAVTVWWGLAFAFTKADRNFGDFLASAGWIGAVLLFTIAAGHLLVGCLMG